MSKRKGWIGLVSSENDRIQLQEPVYGVTGSGWSVFSTIDIVHDHTSSKQENVLHASTLIVIAYTIILSNEVLLCNRHFIIDINRLRAHNNEPGIIPISIYFDEEIDERRNKRVRTMPFEEVTTYLLIQLFDLQVGHQVQANRSAEERIISHRGSVSR